MAQACPSERHGKRGVRPLTVGRSARPIRLASEGAFRAQHEPTNPTDRVRIARTKASIAVATGQLRASPKPKSTPPMATNMPCSGRPRMIEATPIVSGIERACDERGRSRTPRPTRPLEGELDDPARVDADRRVDDDRAGAGRHRQQVVDVELPDDPTADVDRERVSEAARPRSPQHRRRRGRPTADEDSTTSSSRADHIRCHADFRLADGRRDGTAS